MSSSDLAIASETLIGLLQRSEAVLDLVARKLDSEFAERFSKGGPNPAATAQRVRKLARELPLLTQQCQDLIQQKQALIDAAKLQLLSNHERITSMRTRAGLSPEDDDGDDTDAPANFCAALAEWDQQAGSRQEEVLKGQPLVMSRAELNRALATSMMQ